MARLISPIFSPKGKVLKQHVKNCFEYTKIIATASGKWEPDAMHASREIKILSKKHYSLEDLFFEVLSVYPDELWIILAPYLADFMSEEFINLNFYKYAEYLKKQELGLLTEEFDLDVKMNLLEKYGYALEQKSYKSDFVENVILPDCGHWLWVADCEMIDTYNSGIQFCLMSVEYHLHKFQLKDPDFNPFFCDSAKYIEKGVERFEDYKSEVACGRTDWDYLAWRLKTFVKENSGSEMEIIRRYVELYGAYPTKKFSQSRYDYLRDKLRSIFGIRFVIL